MTKRVLVIGTGPAQLDLMELCRNRGYEIFACSYIEPRVGRSLIDHFRLLDIVNVAEIETWARLSKVDWIYSVGSDLAMPTVGLVSERIGLPLLFPSRAAILCNAKDWLRSHLGSTFSGNLPYTSAKSLGELASIDYPAIIKPVDSQGQRGVCLVTSPREIEARFDRARSFSSSGRVIVETFIDGDEVSVNTYSVNGQVVFSLVSDRIAWSEYPGGIIHEHRLPSRYEGQPTLELINALVGQTLDKLAIFNGPAYFQIKVSRGLPYLIEATPRLDGCHLWRLIHAYCGVNLLETTVNHLEGAPIFFPQPPWNSNADRLKLEFLCEKPHQTLDKTRYALNHALYLQWYYQQGETVRQLNGHFEKCGYYIGPG